MTLYDKIPEMTVSGGRIWPAVTNSNALLVGNISRSSIVIADLLLGSVIRVFQLAENPIYAFELSNDQRFLATGYWNKRQVDIWDMSNGELRQSVGPNRVRDLLFHPNGECIVIGRGGNAILVDLVTRNETKIRHCGDMLNSTYDDALRAFVIPGPNCKLLIVDTRTFRTREFPSPVKKSIISVRSSLTERFVIVGLQDGTHLLLESPQLIERWRYRHDRKGELTYCGLSGDCKLIAISCVESNRTRVLDAQSGRVLSEYGMAIDHSRPYLGTKIFCNNGVVFDLASGEIDYQYSSWDWWRKAGFRIPPLADESDD